MSKIVTELNDALKLSTSSPFLFIGSGFSRRYLSSPDWKGLLTIFANHAAPTQEFAYQYFKNKISPEFTQDDDLLPRIAREIEIDYTSQVLTSSTHKALRDKYSVQITNDISCLKIGLSNFFEETSHQFETPNHPEEIAELAKHKDKIAGIITTNFDTFLEHIFNDFEKYVGQKELLFRHTYEMGEIYKIHGCVSDPSSLVVTLDDYDDYNKRNAYLSAKLLTIFLEHPLIFIGYSLNDKNVRSILSDIVQCLTEEQLLTLSKRLFFLNRPNGTRPEGVISRQIEFNNKPLQITEIIRADYSEVYRTIGQFTPKYPPKVLRSLKQNLYELVSSNDPQGRLHVLDIEDIENLDKVDFVLGVGAQFKFGDEGYSGLEPENIYEDLIYDRQKYDPEKIVFMTLPKLLSTHSNSLPVFKYVQEIESRLPERVFCYISSFNSLDSLLSKSIKNKPHISAKSIVEIQTKYNIEDMDGASKCLDDVFRLREDHIDSDQLNQLLVEIYEAYPQMFNNKSDVKQGLKTSFRRGARILDWLKYCEQKK